MLQLSSSATLPDDISANIIQIQVDSILYWSEDILHSLYPSRCLCYVLFSDLLYRQTVPINGTPVELEVIDVSGSNSDKFPAEQVNKYPKHMFYLISNLN